MYLKTVAPEDATGPIAEIYRQAIAQRGFVMAATACWTARPDILPLYDHFGDELRNKFSLGLRTWRLITLIAAKEVPSSYCSHVYSKALIADLGSKERVLAIQRDFRNAGLDARDVAMLAYAQQVARDASKITQADIDALRVVGFTDLEIADIALCASFRCFVAKYFDATGAAPEATYIDEDPDFRDAMTVGKAISR